MSEKRDTTNTRRLFLRFLAASPLLAGGGLIAAPLAQLFASEQNDTKRAHAALAQIAQGSDLIGSPEQALDIMDFEAVARKVLPPAHFGYLSTGVDDDATVRANREGFSHLEIRASPHDRRQQDRYFGPLVWKYLDIPDCAGPGQCAEGVSSRRRDRHRQGCPCQGAFNDSIHGMHHFRGRCDRGTRRSGLAAALYH